MLIARFCFCLCSAAAVSSLHVAERTVTKTITALKTQRVSTSTTMFVTLTNTVTSYHYKYITKTSKYKSASIPIIRAGNPKAAQKKEQGRSQRITTTVTTTLYTTRTTTFTEVQGVYTYITEHPDSTLTYTVTSCAGANPTPSFSLQVVDTTPTRTDEYNLAFITPKPNKGVGPTFRDFDYVSSNLSAALFNIDCLGRLIVKEEGFSNPLYANVSPYQPGFELVYLLPQKEIIKRSYLHIYCNIGPSGYLHCETTQPPPTKNLTMFQTCPIYDEYFKNPLVFANFQSTDSPECFGLRFKPILSQY